MRRLRHTRRLASLLLVGGVAGYWGFTGNTQLGPLPERPSGDRIDSYLGDASIRQFDQQGQPNRTLYSPHIEHRIADGSSHFVRPLLTLHRAAQAPLEIRANAAQSSAKQELIELNGDVRLTEQSALPLQLRTEKLYINPAHHFAWTEAAVAYQRGNSTTHAVGMNAYLDRNRIELLNDVRGHYETR